MMYRIEKEEVKWLLFANNMIIHIENLKRYYQKTTRMHSRFSEVAGLKINIQKSLKRHIFKDTFHVVIKTIPIIHFLISSSNRIYLLLLLSMIF